MSKLTARTLFGQSVEYTPPDVDRITLAGETFRQWRRSGRLTIQDPTESVDWFDPGENAAIAMAREQEVNRMTTPSEDTVIEWQIQLTEEEASMNLHAHHRSGK
jgi:cytochrome c oxidase assembly factor CtaG